MLKLLPATAVLETFTAFPDIVLTPTGRMDKEDFDALHAADMLRLKKIDSFGKLFELTEEAKELLKAS